MYATKAQRDMMLITHIEQNTIQQMYDDHIKFAYDDPEAAGVAFAAAWFLNDLQACATLAFEAAEDSFGLLVEQAIAFGMSRSTVKETLLKSKPEVLKDLAEEASQ